MPPSKSQHQNQPPSLDYSPLPPDQHYVVLPVYYPYRRRCTRTTISIFSIILVAAAVYVLWPSDPHIKIVRMRLKSIHVHRVPHITIDVSISLTVKVRNADLYSMDYRALDVGVGYRGKMLGHVTSEHGHVRARGSSYVDAELELEGVGFFSDVLYFLEDFTKGTVPFDTVTEVKGQLGLLFLQLPLKAKVSCEVTVNTFNQTIAKQNCYPE